ncbi:hypothetical protein [Mesorhizobium sp.]|uniref:hypothetical protein n=1 Tax=Mesorhizobium sp. TaxID=1871066 RepID=UPI000FE78102|nr:hypothetical protein [Mesorhizobium sp.]RWE35004.1 MAG: hypothetical protein EOS77_08505 [Mesorhizobium sp.]
MRIRNARRLNMEPTPRGFLTLARFEFEPVAGVVIYDCILIQAPDGRYLVYGPPAKNNAPILSLDPALRRELIEMTLQGIENDKHCAAA